MEKPSGKLELNWINKDKSIYFEYNQEGEPSKPIWVDRNDIRVSEPRRFSLVEAFGDLSAIEEELENCLIQGENLLALRTLVQTFQKKDAMARFKCVYIDPPYNTGQSKTDGPKEAFTYYNDNLEHSIWLSMMRDRIQLIKQLLRPDGFLVVQIDDNEYARLYLLLAEIFGEANLKTIVVKMAEPTGLKMTQVYSGGIPKLKEYLILAGLSGIKGLNIVKIPKEEWDPEYRNLIRGITKAEMNQLIEIIDLEGARTPEEVAKADKILAKFTIYEKSPLTGKTKYHYTLNSMFKRRNITDEKVKSRIRYENAWRIFRTVETSDAARKAADAKRDSVKADCFAIETPKKKLFIIKKHYNTAMEKPRIRLLLAENYLTVHPGDFWQDIKTTGLDKEGGITFRRSKKPEKLIQRILEMTTKKSDLVLDCFSGSGTTGAVAHKMGRKWVMIEVGTHAESISVPRLNHVIDGTDEYGISKDVNWTGGGGFRYFRQAESVLKGQKLNWTLSNNEIAQSIFLIFGYEFRRDLSKNIYFGTTNQENAVCIISNEELILDDSAIDTIHEKIEGKDHKLVFFATNHVKFPETRELTIQRIPKVLIEKYHT